MLPPPTKQQLTVYRGDSRSPRQVPDPLAGVWYLALYNGKLAQYDAESRCFDRSTQAHVRMKMRVHPEM